MWGKSYKYKTKHGIRRCIIDMLKGASKSSPLTKKEMIAKLVYHFSGHCNTDFSVNVNSVLSLLRSGSEKGYQLREVFKGGDAAFYLQSDFSAWWESFTKPNTVPPTYSPIEQSTPRPAPQPSASPTSFVQYEKASVPLYRTLRVCDFAPCSPA